ncbi:MAG: DUF695 domain-containing protein [Anaerolineales bacterium]|jgi:hypothetical protein
MMEMLVESQVIQSRWGLAIGEDQQSPVIVRYLQERGSDAANGRFSQRLRIKWQYEAMMANGMPTRDQSHQMDIFEGGLLKSVEHPGKGLLIAVVTQDGVREWLMVVAESKAAVKLVEKLASTVEDDSVSVEPLSDSNWGDLSELIDSLTS